MIRILAKDDCFSTFLVRALHRRGVAARIVAQQSKTTSAVVLDAIGGRVAPIDDLRPLFTRHDCLLQQAGCSTLRLPPDSADLVVIGSFADLTIRDYLHPSGTRFFEKSLYVADPAALEQYPRLDHLPPETVAANTAALFCWYGVRHPRARLLWIEYPYIDSAVDRASSIAVPNRVLRERFAAISKAVDAALPLLGVLLYRVPSEIVASRGDGRLWHYADAVYDHAAATVLATLLH